MRVHPNFPAISVLLPVRNAHATLDRALDSLWRQTWSDFEVLAVDDGSTDAGPGILARHARREARLRVIPATGTGLVPALEQARGAARAPYLARMDADDICHPDRLGRQRAHLEANPRVAAVGGRVVSFPRPAVGPGWRRYETWLNGLLTPRDHAREIFVESPLAHPSVLLRAAAVEDVGGYRDTTWAEDYDLWHRLHAAGWHLAKIPAPVLAWRQTPGRLSLNSPRYRHEAFLEARAHYLARHAALHRGRVAIWGAGRTGRRLGRLLAAHGIEITRFYDIDPAKIGRAHRGTPILSCTELAPAGNDSLVVAVGIPGARSLIRPEARRRGYCEGEDLLFAA